MTDKEVLLEIVRFVGVHDMGKMRWFPHNGTWYDRYYGDNISNATLCDRVIEAIAELEEEGAER